MKERIYSKFFFGSILGGAEFYAITGDAYIIGGKDTELLVKKIV
jgi:hypothetical protein